ncbi:hypothetical protein TNCV_2438531 [Trichonephila clavipes]|nr:hypothetical protein TNCV_2438531 [Trichonephila clavipes]
MGHNRTTQKMSTGRRLSITELVGLGSSIHQLLRIAPMERNPMVGNLAIVAVIEEDPTHVFIPGLGVCHIQPITYRRTEMRRSLITNHNASPLIHHHFLLLVKYGSYRNTS